MTVPAWGRAVAGTTADTASELAKEVIHPATGIVMVLIPAGAYLRGASPDDDWAQPVEFPRHRVEFDRPFYIGKYEVTNAQYRKHDDEHHSMMVGDRSLAGESQPVVHVTWDQAKGFCTAFGFRLPTEAEWEYVARAGVTTRFPWGNDPDRGRGWGNLLGPQAYFHFQFSLPGFSFDDPHLATAPVGSFDDPRRRNAFGVHDMTGNVWEFCQDLWLEREYDFWQNGRRSIAQLDFPLMPRVIRGGSWDTPPGGVRLSMRSALFPNLSAHGQGFRVARDP